MIAEVTRTMNEAERRLLTQRSIDTTAFTALRGTLFWCCLWCLGLAICGLILVAMMAFKINPIVARVLGSVLVIIATICLCAMIQLCSSYIHRSNFRRRFRRSEVPEIQRALKDGRVKVRRVVAKAVIEIVDFEDEGGGYIFDLGDNKVLFLKGQRFFPVDDEMFWPNSEFEIVRTFTGAKWVGIFCHGRQLPPVRTIGSEDLKEEFTWSDHEEIVHANLESFATRITAG